MEIRFPCVRLCERASTCCNMVVRCFTPIIQPCKHEPPGPPRTYSLTPPPEPCGSRCKKKSSEAEGQIGGTSIIHAFIMENREDESQGKGCRGGVVPDDEPQQPRRAPAAAEQLHPRRQHQWKKINFLFPHFNISTHMCPEFARYGETSILNALPAMRGQGNLTWEHMDLRARRAT